MEVICLPQHSRSNAATTKHSQENHVDGDKNQPPLLTVKHQHLQAVLVQAGPAALVIYGPDVAGDGGHHPWLSVGLGSTRVSQQSSVLLEQEGALDAVCVGLYK